MTKARTLADLLDSSGDVKSSALDNTSSDLVDDTTPQLGGTLDTNGNPINDASGVDLQHNGTTKLSTTSTGVDVAGTVGVGNSRGITDVFGDYGSVQTVGTKGSWAGYAFGSKPYTLMSNGTHWGVYDDGTNEWSFYYDRTNRYLYTTAEGSMTLRTNITQGSSKAWIFFQQNNTQTIRDSYNISSISDNGSGATYVYYNNDFNNDNSCPVGSTNWNGVYTHESYNAGNHQLRCRAGGSGSLSDRARVSQETHGDLA